MQIYSTNSHQSWYTEAPKVCTSWPWPYFQSHEGQLRWQHMKDGFWSIYEELDVPSQHLVRRITRARRRLSSNGWHWPHFQGHECHLKWVSLNIWRNIFDGVSPNLVYRSNRARQRPSQTPLPWPYFQGHDGHLKWLSLNIWRNIWCCLTKFGTEKHQGKVNTKFKLLNLDLFSRSQRSFKMVSAQYLKKYFKYSYQIWYTEAPGQGQVRTGWPLTKFSI